MNLIRKMVVQLRYFLKIASSLNKKFENINRMLDEIKINQGIILTKFNKQKKSKNIRDFEFKVFSQWGEDGIIQYLISLLEIKNKTFIEFGVEDFFESNCRFLLMKDDWRGFVIDGSAKNIERLKSSYFYWKHHLIAKEAFVTKDNINNILLESGFDEDLGILSVDIDGVDYFVLESIISYKPRILIIEYNSVFGSDRKISVPYTPNFLRRNIHYSNLYFGASLAAMTHLAERKGYALVGVATAGGNAFFVRSDLVSDHFQQRSVAEVFNSSNCRESRDETGNLTYLTGEERLRAIKGLPVVNVETGKTENL